MHIYSIEEIESAYRSWAERTDKAISEGVADCSTINNWEFNFVKCMNGNITERTINAYERQFGDDRRKATPIVICKCCGYPESLSYGQDVQEKMLGSGYCHTCQIWSERVEKQNDENVFIAMNGTERVFYSMGKNTSPFGNDNFNGHAGAVFKIQKGDAEPVFCNNLWHGGGINYLWNDKFPLTAKLLKTDRHEYVEWWVNSGKCSTNDMNMLTNRVMYEVTPPATKEEALEALRESGWVTFRAVQRIKNAREQSGETQADHS